MDTVLTNGLFVIVIISLLLIVFLGIRGQINAFQARKAGKQREYIVTYRFPDGMVSKLQQKYPQLQEKDAKSVLLALKDYFLICHGRPGVLVPMPSQVVDAAWHEFILFTQNYQDFCRRAFGAFFHHTPTEAMPKATQTSNNIQVVWRGACERSGINPMQPKRLPLLFSLDAKFAIADGFYYSLNCLKSKNQDYCAMHIACGGAQAAQPRAATGSHFGCSSGCSGISVKSSHHHDGGGGDSSSSSSSSCGGGCGGGGD